MAEDDRILLTRFAEYVRPYPEKVLARTLGCDERTAKHFRNGTSWPNARHWRLIVRAFGRDVIAAVFMPEIDDTLARLEREARQLENRLAEINARRRADAGDHSGPSERDQPPSDREVDADQLVLFEDSSSRESSRSASGAGQ